MIDMATPAVHRNLKHIQMYAPSKSFPLTKYENSLYTLFNNVESNETKIEYIWEKLNSYVNAFTCCGSTNIGPYLVAKLSAKILQATIAEPLTGIIASVGLAQNFAALKALAGDESQKGHMKRHVRNMAMTVSAHEPA